MGTYKKHLIVPTPMRATLTPGLKKNNYLLEIQWLQKLLKSREETHGVLSEPATIVREDSTISVHWSNVAVNR